MAASPVALCSALESFRQSDVAVDRRTLEVLDSPVRPTNREPIDLPRLADSDMHSAVRGGEIGTLRAAHPHEISITYRNRNDSPIAIAVTSPRSNQPENDPMA